ncbi:precorrin-4 C(11)-methyltransferase [Alkalibacter mobilis]|uniref:precorrin-4 C(11)-methyltransferase n=1 Tax=Alkalibacter mobilis TaxID=2787712 RepID=UPI00189CA3A3|nr:precorrin-4 C(11)-methyltransferase [Alkalibacter mobilis]MBF7097175.1 precorrin-4 C(11)-methyltransferase [Alkalibacter mobilis]
MKKNVYFIGAGPGDPDLITVKGKKIIEESDVIIYAGSLVNPMILSCAKESAEIHNSASMTLEEVIEVMKKGVFNGKLVARVHTGDPSIYGAIREQMDILEDIGISFDVIPGVSSFTAAAAALKKEFTLPGVTQTVICTRMEGRTPVPEDESLEKLASHGASMAIFLSVQNISDVVQKLTVHYPIETPAAVVEKASWNDERIVIGTLADIAQKVREANITKTAQILVGNFLGDEYDLSLLYDKNFTHMFREGIKTQ